CREHDERHHARLGERVERPQLLHETAVEDLGVHLEPGCVAPVARKAKKFSTTSAARRPAAPALWAAARASGRLTITLATPIENCTIRSPATTAVIVFETRIARYAAQPMTATAISANMRWDQWIAVSASRDRSSPCGVCPSSRSTWNALPKSIGGSARPRHSGTSGQASAA